jgi:hypothetical protein
MLKHYSFIACSLAIFLSGCLCCPYGTEDPSSKIGLKDGQQIIFKNDQNSERITFQSSSVTCSQDKINVTNEDCPCKVITTCAQRFYASPESINSYDYSYSRRGSDQNYEFNIFFRQQHFIINDLPGDLEPTDLQVNGKSYLCYPMTNIKDLGGEDGIAQAYFCNQLGLVQFITKNGNTWNRIN